MTINGGDTDLLEEKATSSQNGAEHIAIKMTSSEPSPQPEKSIIVIRLVEWILRFSSIILCTTTLALGIYLEVTKDNVINRGGPIPLIYIALVTFFLLSVLELFGLKPTRLMTHRLQPLALLFVELFAIMLAGIGAAFDDWRYICNDCPDGEQVEYPTPKLWNQEGAMILSTITLHGVLALFTIFEWPIWRKNRAERREERQRRVDMLAVMAMPSSVV